MESKTATDSVAPATSYTVDVSPGTEYVWYVTDPVTGGYKLMEKPVKKPRGRPKGSKNKPKPTPVEPEMEEIIGTDLKRGQVAEYIDGSVTHIVMGVYGVGNTVDVISLTDPESTWFGKDFDYKVKLYPKGTVLKVTVEK